MAFIAGRQIREDIRRTIAAAGFTPAERTALEAAFDKPGGDLTPDEVALLLRYEAMREAA